MSDQTNADPNSVFSEGPTKNENADRNQEGAAPQRTDGDVLKNSDQAFQSNLVGEGRKYSSVEKALEALEHSQSFIDQLKQENQGLREELSGQERMEEILRRVESSRGEGASHSEQGGKGAGAATPPNGAGQNDGDKGSKFTQEEISELVRGEVTRIEHQRTAEQNETEASSKLIDLANGDQKAATDMVQKAAKDLGVSVRYLRQQAQVSPTAFYRLVSASVGGKGEGEGPSVMKSDSGSQNTEAFDRGRYRSGDSEIQPYSHFKKLRKTLSKSEYYSPSVQNAMMRSRQQLGDSFYDE